MIETVGGNASQTGKTAGIITGKEVYLDKAGKSVYNMFCIGSELNAIAQYCKKVSQKVKEL